MRVLSNISYIWKLQLHYLCRLRPFGTFCYLELYLLALGQGLEPISLNGCIMNKDIPSTFLFNKAIPLAIIEPLYLTDQLHQTPPFSCPNQ